MRTRTFLSILILASALLLSGCQKHDTVNTTIVCFDTVVGIQIFDQSSDTGTALLQNCIAMCEDYENRFSRTKEGSEIYNLNHAQGEAFTVSEDTADLIRFALNCSETSGGAFDISIAPVTTLWDIKNNPGILPEEEPLREALSHVDYTKIHVDGNEVTLDDPLMQIDLGGVAKGYIADQLKSYLEEQGVKHALISLGGNILAIGEKLNKTPFRIGIQYPFKDTGEIIAVVPANDQTVVTSGPYERYFKLNDKIYHHIIDPETGYPVEGDLLSVTILTDSSSLADALSTTCYVMGYENGMNLIENMPGVEALFITEDYELHYTSGFPVT